MKYRAPIHKSTAYLLGISCKFCVSLNLNSQYLPLHITALTFCANQSRNTICLLFYIPVAIFFHELENYSSMILSTLQISFEMSLICPNFLKYPDISDIKDATWHKTRHRSDLQLKNVTCPIRSAQMRQR